MRHAATVAISTITESSLPAIVKSYLCQAVDDANHGHTSTANWIPVRATSGASARRAWRRKLSASLRTSTYTQSREGVARERHNRNPDRPAD
jgi:hypothetical protein